MHLKTSFMQLKIIKHKNVRYVSKIMAKYTKVCKIQIFILNLLIIIQICILFSYSLDC